MIPQRTPTGFTIIEMVVVVGVIAILTTIVALQLSGGSQPYELDNARSLISSDIRRTITLAQSGQTHATSTQPKGVLPDGYGIVFDRVNSTYKIYADVDDDENTDDLSSEQEVLDTVEFAQTEGIQGVRITSCTVRPRGGAVFTSDTCNVFVSIPDGAVKIENQPGAQMDLVLTNTHTQETTTLHFNSVSGQVN